MSDNEFTVQVHEEPGQLLWAEVHELPGCFASGATLNELREALSEAIALYLYDDPTKGSIKKMSKLPKGASRSVEVGEMRVKVPV